MRLVYAEKSKIRHHQRWKHCDESVDAESVDQWRFIPRPKSFLSVMVCIRRRDPGVQDTKGFGSGGLWETLTTSLFLSIPCNHLLFHQAIVDLAVCIRFLPHSFHSHTRSSRQALVESLGNTYLPYLWYTSRQDKIQDIETPCRRRLLSVHHSAAPLEGFASKFVAQHGTSHVFLLSSIVCGPVLEYRTACDTICPSLDHNAAERAAQFVRVRSAV